MKLGAMSFQMETLSRKVN